MAELNIVLRSLTKGRARGPDKISSDLIKGSPYILKWFFLDHPNHDSWALYDGVMLVKKSEKILETFLTTVPSLLLVLCTTSMPLSFKNVSPTSSTIVYASHS